MPSHEFFHKLGLYTISDFIDVDLAESLRAEAAAAPLQPATLARDGIEYVNEKTRKSQHALISEATLDMLTERFAALIPDLNQHFDITLNGCQIPKIIVYQPGDFYGPHTDSSTAPGAAEYVRKRQTSVIVFLNNQSGKSQPGDYEGGLLTFYGLFEGEEWQHRGFPLDPEQGLLIAFPSSQLHEITPVTQGECVTIAGWYF